MLVRAIPRIGFIIAFTFYDLIANVSTNIGYMQKQISKGLDCSIGTFRVEWTVRIKMIEKMEQRRPRNLSYLCLTMQPWKVPSSWDLQAFWSYWVLQRYILLQQTPDRWSSGGKKLPWEQRELHLLSSAGLHNWSEKLCTKEPRVIK